MIYNIKQQQQSFLSQYQQSLITMQQQRITNQHNKLINNTPYLTSSFNQQFDIKLKQLVIDYQFDFDKIALYLYYMFPVYEQKITSRTVAVRWWQLEMGKRKGRFGDSDSNMQGDSNVKGQREGLGEEMKEGQQQEVRKKGNNGYQHKQQLAQSLQQLQQQQINKKQQHYITNKTKTTLQQFYTYALQKSLILQQQQQQRLILYKPKFIIDSQYKLQRYEVFDYYGYNNELNNKSKGQLLKQQHNVVEQNYRQNQNINDDQYLDGNENNFNNLYINNNNNNNNSIIHIRQQNIQQILTKVINNQFMYDQFGSFDINQQQQHQLIGYKEKEKCIQKWWENQLSVDSQAQALEQAQSQAQPQAQSQQLITVKINNDYQQQKQLKHQQKLKKNQNHLYDHYDYHHYDHYDHHQHYYDYHQNHQQPHNIQQYPSSQQVCKVNNNDKNQLQLQNIHCYQIDDNWDQYESD